MTSIANIVIPKSLLKPALVLSLVGFALCFLIIGTVFVDLEFLFGSVFMLLFLGIFPLWFGAVSISVRRMRGDRRTAWKVLFHGLPRWFGVAFYCYFYVIALGMLAGFVQQFRGRPSWIALGFVLIPSVFYLACIGAYWSELRERATGVPGVPPLLDPPLLEGRWRQIPKTTARVLVKKHWLRMLPNWLAVVFFIVYWHLDPQLKFDNATYIVVCVVPLVLSACIGTLLSIKVMHQNDYPFVEKMLLLIAFPLWGIAFLTHFACVLIFRGSG